MTHADVLARIADAVVCRVFSETECGQSIDEALERAYPFGDDAGGRTVWAKVLSRSEDLLVHSARKVVRPAIAGWPRGRD
jgi:hypothetical protein